MGSGFWYNNAVLSWGVTFHVVCNIAVWDSKSLAKFQSLTSLLDIVEMPSHCQLQQRYRIISSCSRGTQSLLAVVDTYRLIASCSRHAESMLTVVEIRCHCQLQQRYIQSHQLQQRCRVIVSCSRDIQPLLAAVERHYQLDIRHYQLEQSYTIIASCSNKEIIE